MKVLIVGAGYVGTVNGACLAKMGHFVTVADTDASKVAKIAKGESPISEPGLSSLLRDMTSAKRLIATADMDEPAESADIILICVGTPSSQIDGSADLSAVTRVFERLSEVIARRSTPVAIAITSTVPPGTTVGVAKRILDSNEGSKNKYSLACMPEFLREGSAVLDFENPTRVIIGVGNVADAPVFASLRADVPERIHVVGVAEAELLKSVENAWHATKVVFGNEVGRLASRLGIDGSKVMDLLSLDNKQNISKAYLRPGFAFGGSCLPKDVRSIVRLSELAGVSSPLLASLNVSNRQQIELSLVRILETGSNRVGVLGLAFKANTDDLRESPAMELVQRLLGLGIEVRVHDFEALRHDMYGSNLAAVNSHPHIRRLMLNNASEVALESDVVVLAQHNKKYLSVVEEFKDRAKFIDLVGLLHETPDLKNRGS